MSLSSSARTLLNQMNISCPLSKPCTAVAIIIFVLMLLVPSLKASTVEGFISIDCGGNRNYRDNITGIQWVSDSAWISTGLSTDLKSFRKSQTMKSLRYFPEVSQPKYCYVLPVVPKRPYLIRAGFLYGNYDGNSRPPSFMLAFDSTKWADIRIDGSQHPVYHEIITWPKRESIQVCLLRTEVEDTPFINSLELRPLPSELYSFDSKDTYLTLLKRVNFGGAFVRYPHDKWDRLWTPDIVEFPELSTILEPTSMDFISKLSAGVPSVIMQTGSKTKASVSFVFEESSSNQLYYLNAYFPQTAHSSQRRGVLRFFINAREEDSINFTDNPVTLKFSKVQEAIFNFTLVNRDASTTTSVINALEVFGVNQVSAGTDPDDAQLAKDIAKSFGLGRWIGDPCLPLPWDWITCSSEVPAKVLFMKLPVFNSTAIVPVDTASSVLKNLLERNQEAEYMPRKMLQGLHNLSSYVAASTVKVVPASPEESTSPAPSPGPEEESGGASISPGIIAGVSIGAIGIVILVISAVYYFCGRKKASSTGSCFELVNPGKDGSGAANTKPGDTDEQQDHLFSHAKLMHATGSFSTKIGEGGFGPVFYGELNNGKEIAVKVMSKASHQGPKEFFNEVELLQRIHHKNLVSLIGYSKDKENMLVYEFMSGGTLREHLNGVSQPLDWRTRLNIAYESSKGLEYLHTGCEPTVIHRDVKSTNILLNSKFAAKVSDFGLSRHGPTGEFTHVSTIVKGTPGYLDPEYYMSQQLTEKSDVFSFGVVLLEIITGRDSIIHDPKTQRSKSLTEWVRPLVESGDLQAIVDPQLAGKYKSESMWKTTELALQCVNHKSAHRPTMVKVAAVLKEVIEIEDELVSVQDEGSAPPIHLMDSESPNSVVSFSTPEPR